MVNLYTVSGFELEFLILITTQPKFGYGYIHPKSHELILVLKIVLCRNWDGASWGSAYKLSSQGLRQRTDALIFRHLCTIKPSDVIKSSTLGDYLGVERKLGMRGCPLLPLRTTSGGEAVLIAPDTIKNVDRYNYLV